MKMKPRIFKKILLFLTAIFLLILVIGIWTARKLPPEAKFLINHLNSEEIMKDMINDPEKYKKQPCFEIEFNKEKYCFDRSRAYFEKKYIDRITKEDESAVVYFLPKVLSNFLPKDREVRVDLRVDKYHRDDFNEPERLANASIKDNSKKEVTFKKLVKNSKNGEFIEITSLMEKDWIFKQNHFVTFSNNRIIGLFRVGSSESFKYTGDIMFQHPKNFNYFEVHFVSNQPTQKEFLQTALDIAQEFNQFLSDSKVTSQPLSTNSTTN
jgi:hypothetical protein